MLFHVTVTHTEENCPAYHPQHMPEVMAGLSKQEELAKELNLRVHFAVTCPPTHEMFFLLEADSLAAVSRYLFALPIPAKTEIKPVDQTKAALSKLSA